MVRVRRPVLEFYTTYVISPQRLTLETSNFVQGSAMQSLSLVMSECFLSGRGQGHVSNFYIVDLENYATASRRYTGDIGQRFSNRGPRRVPTGSARGFRKVVIVCTVFNISQSLSHCLSALRGSVAVVWHDRLSVDVSY